MIENAIAQNETTIPDLEGNFTYRIPRKSKWLKKAIAANITANGVSRSTIITQALEAFYASVKDQYAAE